MSRTRFLLAAWVLLITACRDGAEPFLIERTPFDSAGGLRLTYSQGHDRAPAWNDVGDSIYYVTEGRYYPFRTTPGLLLAVPARGGAAEVLLSDRQLGSARTLWLTSPAVSPAGNTIAFVELTQIAEPLDGCIYVCTPRDTTVQETNLMAGVLRVATLHPTSVADLDTMRISFEGWTFEAGNHRGLEGTWIVSVYPYQRRFGAEATYTFRPSWSPDGRQLAYSDGLQLIIYDTQTNQSRVLPNTTDGIYPAWSPDGTWIAYAQLQRGEPVVTECLCINERNGLLNEDQHRTVYNATEVGNTALRLIRPDGSEQRNLGSGDMPAWTPAGEVVFRRGDALWRTNVDGSNAQEIPMTAFGEEPAVAPDGRHLAFTRPTGPSFDIWVVPLQ